jgi:hypothetical protein
MIKIGVSTGAGNGHTVIASSADNVVRVWDKVGMGGVGGGKAGNAGGTPQSQRSLLTMKNKRPGRVTSVPDASTPVFLSGRVEEEEEEQEAFPSPPTTLTGLRGEVVTTHDNK